MLGNNPELDALAAAAETYVEGAFGFVLGLQPIAPATLPHFILDRYRMWKGSLLGQPMLLVAGKGWKPGDGFTADFIKQRDLLRDRLGVPLVVLLLDYTPAAVRKQMVARKVGFVAPGSQFYIPEALLDLNERSARARPEPSGIISPTAQLMLLAALQGQQLDDANQTELAARFQVAVMSISRAFDELEALKIGRTVHVGRQRRLHLNVRGGDLWASIKDKLQTPVRKLRRVYGILNSEVAPRAGATALAHYTMLGESRVEHRAIAATLWKKVERQLHESSAFDFARPHTEVETWTYDPRLLARDGFVDPLSLYLSIRYSLDERVAQAADQLLERFGW
jgi:hypothetical protein